MKGMATVTLLALAAILCVQASHAQDNQAKWLIGIWEGTIQSYSPREGPGRIMVVTNIAPDGKAQGVWGATGGGLGKAEIRLTELRIHLITSAGSIVELTRVGEDRLEGSFTLKTGSTFALTLIKQMPSREAKPSILADGVHLTKEGGELEIEGKPVDLNAFLGTWEGPQFLGEGSQTVGIIVVTIRNKWAYVIDYWGDYMGRFRTRANCSRRVWKVLPDGQLVWTSPSVSFWLKMAEDQSIIEFKKTQGSWTNYITLKRLARETTAVQSSSQTNAQECWP